jgi:catechol 2,3-dioxygenase-like lactoylglutathione lyase family enzyme
MIRGVNHITLAVADVPRALAFYHDGLGLPVHKTWEAGAYLTAGEMWLCLSLDPVTSPRRDYTHIAFDVSADDFPRLSRHIKMSGAPIWKTNRSEGASLYFCDPDGHKLEIHVGTLAARLAVMDKELETC